MGGFIRGLKIVAGPRRRLARHFHDEYSLAFLHAGRSRARLGGEELALAGGDLLLIPPRLAHACEPEAGEEWRYSLFFLEPAWVESSLGWESPPSRVLRAPMPPGLAGDQARIGEARGEGPFLETLVRGALAAFGPAGGEAGSAVLRAPAPALAAARRHIEAHLGSRLPVEELAQLAGLSKHRFIRAFSAAYGLTPHAYILSARVNRAKRQLAAGEALSKAAYENGFCDQSHFSRAFASRVGLTPGGYAAG
ncbi:MAG TPA: AraC family transcriptional regulator [Spirochaetales bacterium]|nr:AraC family transcriptional regulator [Spirochaetales bacterium]HRY54854.1 AraC family transcriptional regulator [Spirochaetia bacterium]HRZ65778.1 AraC family transcriptional regulator [Spirochaetia bacterium]